MTQIIKLNEFKIVQTRSSVVEADILAINTWLQSYQSRSSETVRSFKKEAVRFLMWVEVEKGARESLLRAVTAEDANNYLMFLNQPKQFPQWVLDKYGYKSQPFKVTGLSRSSIRQTLTILKTMFNAMLQMSVLHYSPFIKLNPLVLIKAPPVPQNFNVKLALDKEEWSFVQDAIENLPRVSARDNAHYHRTRWLFQVLYRLWLRRSTLVNARMGDFYPTEVGWRIRVISKGGKVASLVATKKLMAELKVYRNSLGLSDTPLPGESRPLVPTLHNEFLALSADSVYAICRTIYAEAAEAICDSYPYSAEKLLDAGPHTMRHTGITHALYSGVDLVHVRAHAMHSSIQTTIRYVDAQDTALRDELEKCE